MRGRLDLIIFLAVIGWLALKFIGAWLEQRSGRGSKDDDDPAPAGGANPRRRSLMASPSPVRRPRVNPSLPAAESASPPEVGNLREWFRDALKQAQPVRPPAGGGMGKMVVVARPPVIVPVAAETEAEREGLEHQTSAPLSVLEDASSRPVVVSPAMRRFRPAAAALLRATRQRHSLRQGILLAEVLGRPRAFDA